MCGRNFGVSTNNWHKSNLNFYRICPVQGGQRGGTNAKFAVLRSFFAKNKINTTFAA